MYLSSVRAPKNTGSSRAVISGNVVALGLVSLLTDVSAEMVTAILPAYLVLGLHLSVLQYGALDGLYTGATALTRLLGGWVGDRTWRHKLTAGLGYALSAACKAGLLLAGRSAVAIGGVLVIDRMGKGLRTAPRDALIALSVPEKSLGRAFGVHRAMDSAGAFAGPLVAIGVLALAGSASGYDAVFVASFCIALLGVLVLVLFVRNQMGERGSASLRQAFGLLKTASFRRACLVAMVLGLVTIGDGFVYLVLQRREDLPQLWFPLLAVGVNLGYLLLAGPVGVLADRIGRWVVLIGGHVALLAVYLLLVAPWHGTGWVVLILLLYGGFYAATDGVLMAAVAPLIPESLHGSGMAVVKTAQALAYLGSSVAFGFAWQSWGHVTALWCAVVAVVVALPVSWRLLR
ncbi:MFS transporter [Lentzea sp. NPDC051838]|uniref:MFS transporter n=1 Tax=Lentzea sp. NPDC051838 TaxID=3154849 RepID=UPI003442C4F7